MRMLIVSAVALVTVAALAGCTNGVLVGTASSPRGLCRSAGLPVGSPEWSQCWRAVRDGRPVDQFVGGLPTEAVSASSPVAVSANAGNASTICKGSIKKGMKAFNAGDHEAAYCHWWPKALSGDAVGQNNIGVLYERGLSTRTPQSDELAADYFLAAARQGHPLAMRNLAQVQQRLGHHEAAASWLQLAEQTEQQLAIRQAQYQAALAQSLNSAAFSIGCALAGGCAPQMQPITTPSMSQRTRPSSPAPQPAPAPVRGYMWGNQCIYHTPNGQRVMQPVNGICPPYGQ